MGRPLEAEDRLELDTEHFIRHLCREYGITAARYFDMSDLNSPHQERPMSYSTFGHAMSGYLVTEEHQQMMAMSLSTVRQELRRQGAKPLEETLPRQFTALLKEHFDDDGEELFTAQELSNLRRLLRAAQRRSLARSTDHGATM